MLYIIAKASSENLFKGLFTVPDDQVFNIRAGEMVKVEYSDLEENLVKEVGICLCNAFNMEENTEAYEEVNNSFIYHGKVLGRYWYEPFKEEKEEENV